MADVARRNSFRLKSQAVRVKLMPCHGHAPDREQRWDMLLTIKISVFETTLGVLAQEPKDAVSTFINILKLCSVLGFLHALL